MKRTLYTVFAALFVTAPAFAANEGVPTYYQKNSKATGNQIGYTQYAAEGYSKYVGQSGSKQIVGNRTTTYQIPRQAAPSLDTATASGAMTVNGIAVAAESEKATTLYAGYTRRFADFDFKTGVNSILEWNKMWFNELNVGARHKFSLYNFDMFIYGDYAYGNMSSGGLSMDYDLEPYSASDPTDGIFTISVGSESGKYNHMRVGMGAHHVWDVGGWKFSPSIGYEIFKHELKMSDHYYPNPGIYLPLMTDAGNYVYGYTDANYDTYYFSVPVANASSAEDQGWYQVCMSPEDIMVVYDTTGGAGGTLSTLESHEYNISMGSVPWGVTYGECVVIGGDGPIKIDGTTHIYNTTWSGFYVGLEIEKQMTLADKLRLYMQFGMPRYSSEGTWPNRDDWQQHPSFTDKGSNGAYSYRFEMEYDYQISDRLALDLKVDTDYFHVGKIAGDLYLAEYTEIIAETDTAGNVVSYSLETHPAETQHISESLKEASWRSFGLHLGLKYSF